MDPPSARVPGQRSPAAVAHRAAVAAGAVAVALLVNVLWVGSLPSPPGLPPTDSSSAGGPVHAFGGAAPSLVVGSTPYAASSFNLLDGQGIPGEAGGYSVAGAEYMLYDALNGAIYVVGSSTNNIAVVNGATGLVSSVIDLATHNPHPSGTYPPYAAVALALDPRTGLLYVSNGGNDLRIVDTATNAVVGSVPFGQGVNGITVVASLGELFGADTAAGAVDILAIGNRTQLASVPVGPSPLEVAYDPTTGFVYATVSGNHSVVAVDPTTHRVVQRLAVPLSPWGIAYDPHVDRLYTSGCGALYNLSVIDPVNGTLRANSTLGGRCGGPVTYLAGLGELAVTNPSGARWCLVNDSTNTLTSAVLAGYSPYDAAFDPVTRTLFVDVNGYDRLDEYLGPAFTNFARIPLHESARTPVFVPYQNSTWVFDWSQNSATVVNMTTGRVAHVYDAGSEPGSAVYDPVNHEIYISGYGDIKILYASNGTTVMDISTGAFMGMAVYDPLNNHVYVLGQGYYISTQPNLFDINASTNTMAAPTTFGGDEIALDPVRGFLYVTEGGTNNVAVVNTSTDAVVGHIPVGQTPISVAFDPVTQTIWAGNQGSNNVTVINTSRGQAVANLTLSPAAFASRPAQITYDPALNDMAVLTDNLSANWHFFNASTNAPVANLSSSASAATYSGEVTYAPALTALVVADGNVLRLIRPLPPGPVFQQVHLDLRIGSVGVTSQLNVSAFAAGGPVSYQYLGLPPGCASANLSVLNCTPLRTGLFPITINVTDPQGRFIVTTVDLAVLAGLSVGTVTAHPVGGIVNETRAVSVAVAGGVGPYTYRWSGLPPGCPTKPSASFLCVPNVAGTYSIQATVNDSEGVSIASTAAANISVFRGLTLLLGSNHSEIDLGQSVNLSGQSAGGSGVAAFVWAGLPPGCVGSNVSSLNCTPTRTGQFTVFLNATDLGGAGNGSSRIGLRVNADPNVSVIHADRPSMDLGQTVRFNATVGGGTGVYRLAWLGLPPGCATANSTSLTCTPTMNGSYSLTLTVNDTVGFAVTSAALAGDVAPSLAANGLSAHPPAIDLGQNLTLNVTVGGAHGVFTYTWTGLPTGCASRNASQFVCTPTGTGNFTVAVNLSDPEGAWKLLGGLVVEVWTGLFGASVAALPSAIDLGGTVQLSAGAVGGVMPLSYVWTGLPGGCSTSDTASLSCRPTVTGTFPVVVTVYDASNASSVSPSNPVLVAPALQVGIPTATVSSTDLGQNVTFTTNFSGGVSGDAFLWSGLPNGCAPANATQIACQPTSVGWSNVTTTITDGFQSRGISPALTFRVYALPVAQIVLSRSSLDVGGTLGISLSVVGGSGLASIQWSGLPAGCTPPSPTTLSWNCTVTAAGTFDVSATVNDSDRSPATTSVHAVTVFPDPTFQSFSANRTAADAGQRLVFTVVVASPGAGNLTFVWSGLPAGCHAPAPGELVVSCDVVGVGSFSVTISATDANGYRITSAPVTIVVTRDPVISSLAATPNPATVGATLVWLLTVSGGSGNAALFWSGAPPGCLLPTRGFTSFTCTPTSVGSFQVFVSLTDSNGVNVHSAPIALTVGAAHPNGTGPTGSFAPGSWVYALIAAVVVLAVVAALLLLRRRGPPARSTNQGRGDARQSAQKDELVDRPWGE
jgi:YVTN family beta-propeller protein